MKKERKKKRLSAFGGLAGKVGEKESEKGWGKNEEGGDKVTGR